MIFSSIEFLLCFFPVFLLCYSLTPRKLKNAALLLGSLIFYAFGDVRSLPILMASILFNYFIGRGMAEPDRRKGAYGKRQKRRIEKKNRRLLAAAVVVNIGVLCLFKYLPGRAGLPLGISFYTFQVLSYLIDVYRGEQKKELSFVRFAAYISMFPQLVSGPIVLYGEVRSKLWNRRFCAETLQDGLKVFTAGLAAKVLLADRIGILWHDVQVTGFESISTPLAWLGAVAFSLKIYFDFYGYSLMAVGLGRILGFELPQNFREPYMAVTVRDFYRRWHMTLGRWFCKYVYIPLGGSRNGELRTALSLLAVWFLTGIWHGSTANFLIWSMMLWLLIVMERQAERAGILKALDRGALRVIPHLYLWTVIPVTWICFAVTDVSQLQVYLGRMFGLVQGLRVSAGDWRRALETYWYLFGAGFFACTPICRKLFRRWKDTPAGIVLLAALFWLCVWRLQVEGKNPFMYFGF